MVVFGLGVVAAVLSIAVVRVQHNYYRAARDHMKRIEDVVTLPRDQRIDTTANLGGRPRRISVNQIVYLILTAIVVANFAGMWWITGR